MDVPTEPDDPKPDADFGSLPTFASYYTGEDGKPIDAVLLYQSFVCEECETLSTDVIGYTLPTLILIPRAMRFDELVKCRRCMRKHIIIRLPLAILLAHVFSPFIVIWWAVVVAQTFFRKPH